MRPVAERLGIAALSAQREDDDSWAEKVDLLMQDPVPVVSFTFGIPSAGIVKALRTRGTITMQTVTSVEEALAARDAGIDVIVAQSRDAGGHVGTTDPLSALPTHSLLELVREIRSVSTLPIIGTGGISTSSAVHTTMAAGAQAVAVGTALLLAPESGASAVYKTALRDSKYTRTQVTRAFTGRFARALVNQFVEDHSAAAPAGYPALASPDQTDPGSGSCRGRRVRRPPVGRNRMAADARKVSGRHTRPAFRRPLGAEGRRNESPSAVDAVPGCSDSCSTGRRPLRPRLNFFANPSGGNAAAATVSAWSPTNR
ncbi:nitronate monooxygenase [Microbacterium sp. P05]|uniref:nitronate monooxygenase n=1 Tax=Microbacterium sp. P05 TaxID=3366948 RepID=UPI0037454925